VTFFFLIMRYLPLLVLASLPVFASNCLAQEADTGFHAFAPSAKAAAPATDGMTVYRPPGALGQPATIASAAPGSGTPAAATPSGAQDDPYADSLKHPMPMPMSAARGEPMLPPPMTSKGLPLPPVPVAPGLAAPPAFRMTAPAPAEQINAFAPPNAAASVAAASRADIAPAEDLTGVPVKARELIVDKYSVSPRLKEAAIAFVKTNLAEWNQVKRSHRFSRVATRLSVESQICLAAKIDHYAPDLAESFTKEFKTALTSTSELRQLYYDALQAAEYQEVVVDKDTDEACRDVDVTPENVDAP
jgi:hypothetical protein